MDREKLAAFAQEVEADEAEGRKLLLEIITTFFQTEGVAGQEEENKRSVAEKIDGILHMSSKDIPLLGTDAPVSDAVEEAKTGILRAMVKKSKSVNK